MHTCSVNLSLINTVIQYAFNEATQHSWDSNPWRKKVVLHKRGLVKTFHFCYIYIYIYTVYIHIHENEWFYIFYNGFTYSNFIKYILDVHFVL